MKKKIIKIININIRILLKNKKLKKGTYYICCDINYRFLGESKNSQNIHGYHLNIFSEKEIKKENIKRIKRLSNMCWY